MGLKREIVLLASENILKDLYYMVDICLIIIHCLEGLSKRARKLDVHERLDNTLLDVVKHPNDNG